MRVGNSGGGKERLRELRGKRKEGGVGGKQKERGKESKRMSNRLMVKSGNKEK